MGKVNILLSQHIGAPCEPCVKKGDKVKRGTLIAKPTGLGANIFSSVEGVVDKITDTSIYIKTNDKLDATKNIKFVPMNVDDSDIVSCVKESGLVGMGGAGFPTSIKIGMDLKGGYVLVNAAECEPLIEHNMKQILQQADKTIRGIKYCMKASNAKEGVIAIKEKHTEQIKVLNEAIKDEPNIRIHLLADLYPMGEERAVVREVLGKLLNVDQLPSEADAVVINIETVLRVAEAVEDKRPVITKNVTVAGKLKSGTDSIVFMDVPIGTPVKKLIKLAGGIDGDYGEIIMGGPFTGKAVDMDTPITKTTGAILVAKPFEDLKGAKLGILLCACGGNLERMEDLAKKMNGKVVCTQACKQAVAVKNALKCENPGNCPGQAQKCLEFKKQGCTDILIGNCSDCTNTVMGSAPKLGLNVHHQTDNILQTCGMEPMRYLTKSKTVTEEDSKTDGELNKSKDSSKIDTSKLEDSSKTDTVIIEKTFDSDTYKITIDNGKDIDIEFEF